jgi:hypothetical protein
MRLRGEEEIMDGCRVAQRRPGGHIQSLRHMRLETITGQIFKAIIIRFNVVETTSRASHGRPCEGPPNFGVILIFRFVIFDFVDDYFYVPASAKERRPRCDRARLRAELMRSWKKRHAWCCWGKGGQGHHGIKGIARQVREVITHECIPGKLC